MDKKAEPPQDLEDHFLRGFLLLISLYALETKVF